MSISIFKSKEDICKFIKECAKLGVTEISVGDLSFSLAPAAPKPYISRTPRKATREAALATEQKGIKEQQDADEDEDRSQLVIDDPEAFEALNIGELKG